MLDAALGRIPEFSIFGDDYPTPDGSCLRDYIQVTDLVRAHMNALRHLRKGGESVTCNVGYSRGYSVLETIDSVRRVSGRNLAVQTAPRRDGAALPGGRARRGPGAGRDRRQHLCRHRGGNLAELHGQRRVAGQRERDQGRRRLHEHGVDSQVTGHLSAGDRFVERDHGARVGAGRDEEAGRRRGEDERARRRVVANPLQCVSLVARELVKRDLLHTGTRNVDGRTLGQIAASAKETPGQQVVTTGIADSLFTEIDEGALKEGDAVVIGIDASATLEACREQVGRIARSTAALIGVDRDLREDEITVLEGWAGDLYGIPVESTMEAMALGAQLEAMITDPVYEGKSLAGLVDLVTSGDIPRDSHVLYAHLGGQPTINAYHSLWPARG